MAMRQWLIAAVLAFGAACAKPNNGSALMLNMQPAPPTFASRYDFDLVERALGEACVSRGWATNYWVGGAAFEKAPTDPLTQQAIAAAIFNVMSKHSNADSYVTTRAITKSNGSDQVCATVWGYLVRLSKAENAHETP
jgi:hypothetical protein